MKIKILVSCSGDTFSYRQGETVNVISEIAKDLIAAGYAEEVKIGRSKEGGIDADA